MNSFQVSIIILLLIVILTCTLSSYKIETFTQESSSPPTELSAYKYLVNVKKWNGVQFLKKGYLLVLFTMRVLVGKQYNANNREFPYLNGLVIPYQHLPIFNRDINDRSPMVFEIADGLKTVVAQPTNREMYPNGLYINLDDVTYDDFKDILHILYLEYDREYLEELGILQKRKDIIYKQVWNLEELRDTLNDDLQRKTKELNDTKAMYEKELEESKRLEQEMKKFRACG